MARTYGAKQHTAAEIEYIRKHWQTDTDQKMAMHLGMKPENLQKLRLSRGWRRKNYQLQDPKVIGLILEFFANGKTMMEISKIVNKHHCTVSRIIESNWLFKKRSYDTVTLVIDSKMNHNDP